MKKSIPYVYCICRIDRKYWKNINHDLQAKGYSEMKCFVPTVQILKNSKNKKDNYEDIPLLFNYGFVRMRSDKAFNRNLLIKIRKDIPGILNFMKSLSPMHPKRQKRRVDNAEDFDDFSKVATITREEFKYYKKLSKQNKIYNLSDIAVKAGDYIILKKYPFEGLPAKVIDFNFSNHTVRVEIYPGEGSVLSLQLPLENVLYTIYDSYDEDELLSSDSVIDIDNISEEEEPIDEYEENLINSTI